MSCKTIRRKRTKVCIGGMRHRIKINDRTLTPPSDDDVDFDEILSSEKTIPAGLDTSNGIEVFDGTNLLGVATHMFYIRFIAGLTSEKWVEFKGNFYRILDIQNYQEADKFMILRCVVRGDITKAVNLL